MAIDGAGMKLSLLDGCVSSAPLNGGDPHSHSLSLSPPPLSLSARLTSRPRKLGISGRRFTAAAGVGKWREFENVPRDEISIEDTKLNEGEMFGRKRRRGGNNSLKLLLSPLLISLLLSLSTLTPPAAAAASTPTPSPPPPPRTFLQVQFAEQSAVSFSSNVTLGFNVSQDYGNMPCLLCNVTCSVDGAEVASCNNGSISVAGLEEGAHNFTVSASVDSASTVATTTVQVVLSKPTAALTRSSVADPQVQTLLVQIDFTRDCFGFSCNSTANCGLYVTGNGTVVPSSFTELVAHRTYSVLVNFDNTTYGRVRTAVESDACVDEWGQSFESSNFSKAVTLFDRRPVQASIDSLARRRHFDVGGAQYFGEAVNRSADLLFAVRFNSSLVNTTDEVKSQISVTGGTLALNGTSAKKNRRYMFTVIPASNPAIIKITLQGGALMSSFGIVPSAATSDPVYYDERPFHVTLSTSVQSKVKDKMVGIEIRFSQPVDSFPRRALSIQNGKLSRLEAASTSLYVATVAIKKGRTANITLPFGAVYNLAGSPNMDSNSLVIERYSEQTSSLVMSSIISGGLLASITASGVLSLSMAALSTANNIPLTPIPARNLLGLASHVQVFAFSDWLGVQLPTVYRETIRGLRWTIPHVSLPWEKSEPAISLPPTSTAEGASIYYAGRHLLSEGPLAAMDSFKQLIEMPLAKRTLSEGSENVVDSAFSGCLVLRKDGQDDFGCDKDDEYMEMAPRRVLQEGLVLTEEVIQTWFLTETDVDEDVRKTILGKQYATGTMWHAAARNLFWVALIAGGLLLLRSLVSLSLSLSRWRRGGAESGAAAHPLSAGRLELFLLLAATPAVCQACAMLIRGGSTGGLWLGIVLLINVPGTLLYGSAGFLIYNLIMRHKVVFKEPVRDVESISLPQESAGPFPCLPAPFSCLVGRQTSARWQAETDAVTPKTLIMGRWGLLFESRRGSEARRGTPITAAVRRVSLVREGDNVRQVIEEELGVGQRGTVMGTAQSLYLLVEIGNRIVLGLLMGVVGRGSSDWTQVSILIGSTGVVSLYLLLVKPFISRGVQLAETISFLCELGLYGCAFALLGKEGSESALGIAMLSLLFLSFTVQILALWYGFYRQVKLLSDPSTSPSFVGGLPLIGKGLLMLLPFWPLPENDNSWREGELSASSKGESAKTESNNTETNKTESNKTESYVESTRTDSKTGSADSGGHTDSAIIVKEREGEGGPLESSIAVGEGGTEGEATPGGESKRRRIWGAFFSKKYSKSFGEQQESAKAASVGKGEEEDGEISSQANVEGGEVEEAPRPTVAIYPPVKGEEKSAKGGWGMGLLLSRSGKHTAPPTTVESAEEGEAAKLGDEFKAVPLDTPPQKGEGEGSEQAVGEGEKAASNGSRRGFSAMAASVMGRLSFRGETGRKFDKEEEEEKEEKEEKVEKEDKEEKDAGEDVGGEEKEMVTPEKLGSGGMAAKGEEREKEEGEDSNPLRESTASSAPSITSPSKSAGESVAS